MFSSAYSEAKISALVVIAWSRSCLERFTVLKRLNQSRCRLGCGLSYAIEPYIRWGHGPLRCRGNFVTFRNVSLRFNVLKTHTKTRCSFGLIVDNFLLVEHYLQCFDAVGWAAGRASGL